MSPNFCKRTIVLCKRTIKFLKNLKVYIKSCFQINEGLVEEEIEINNEPVTVKQIINKMLAVKKIINSEITKMVNK